MEKLLISCKRTFLKLIKVARNVKVSVSNFTIRELKKENNEYLF